MPAELQPYMSYLLPAAICGGVVVLLVIGTFFGGRVIKRKNAEWAAYAASRGLTLGGQYPMYELTGTMHGLPVRMVIHSYSETVQRGGRSRPTTRYKTEMMAQASTPIGDLSVVREGSAAAQVVGGQDIQTGDAAFDAKFVVRSADPGAAALVLGPAARAALLDAERAVGAVYIEAGSVRTMHLGQPNVANMDGAFEIVARAASSLGR